MDILCSPLDFANVYIIDSFGYITLFLCAKMCFARFGKFGLRVEYKIDIQYLCISRFLYAKSIIISREINF